MAHDNRAQDTLPDGFVRRIRVAILSSSAIMRRGCAAVVEEAPHLEVTHVGSVDGDDPLQGAPADFVVVGMALGNDDGARTIHRLVRRGECVIAVTAPGVRTSTAFELGSHAVVDGLDSDESVLVRTIDRIVRGEASPPPPDADAPRMPAISPREEDVLRELARGSTDREIAGTLGISVRTVQSHLDRIREKTGRRRRAELTVLAFELGIAPKDSPPRA